MEALKDALRHADRRMNDIQPRGKIARALHEADDETRELLLALLRGPLPAEELAARLARGGVTVSASTVRAFRRAMRREDVKV